VEEHTTTTETAAAVSATERDSLVSRLVLAEDEIEKLRVAATSAEEAVERAKNVVAVTEATVRDAAHTASREKVVLETRVLELECDLGIATSDLATTSRQFSQVTNQLQVVTEEAA
jgi:hypothetical protein